MTSRHTAPSRVRTTAAHKPYITSPTSLFDLQPPMDGDSFDARQDGKRLHRQLATVKAQMAGGRWYSLAELERLTGYPQASISARIRDLRKIRFGGYVVERQRLKDGSGQHFYRLVTPIDG